MYNVHFGCGISFFFCVLLLTLLVAVEELSVAVDTGGKNATVKCCISRDGVIFLVVMDGVNGGFRLLRVHLAPFLD